MKGKLHFSILLFFIFSYRFTFANNGQDWQTIYLTPGGGNLMDGVEAYFQLATCNGEQVVYVKFINHNEYSVRLEWFDAIFTQELKWINKDAEENKKSLLIAPKVEAAGKCSGTGSAELIIDLKDFNTDKKEFKRYSAFQLNVLAVQ